MNNQVNCSLLVVRRYSLKNIWWYMKGSLISQSTISQLYFHDQVQLHHHRHLFPNTMVFWVMWNMTPALRPIRASYLRDKTITNSLHHHKHPHKTFTPDEATRNPSPIGQPAVSREQESHYHWLIPDSSISTGSKSSCIDPESSSPLAREGGFFFFLVIRYDEKTYHKLRRAPSVAY